MIFLPGGQATALIRYSQHEFARISGQRDGDGRRLPRLQSTKAIEHGATTVLQQLDQLPVAKSVSAAVEVGE